MAKDHYVAQTYLKHFADDKGMLHGYKKPTGEHFPCWPKDVCHEWNGDLNPARPDQPDLLGQYRKIFEPPWNVAVEDLQKRQMAKDIKMIVSLCYAHMMICVPAWRRVAASFWEHSYEARLRIKMLIYKERGIKDELLEEGVAMLEQGKLKLEVDANAIKGWLTSKLTAFACQAYHADWSFVENDTDIPFYISDNPVAVRYGETPGAPVIKFMPITSKLGLMMVYDPREERKGIVRKPPEEIERLLAAEPAGSIRSVIPEPATVRSLNRLIVQCAETVVFANAKSEAIAKLVEKYGRYRMESDFPEWREPDGSYVHGFVMKVRPRTD